MFGGDVSSREHIGSIKKMRTSVTKNKIIHFLAENKNEFTSGEDLSSALGFSRAGLWKHIKQLREEGYVIEAVPNKGYKLRSSPDAMYSHSVQDGLNTTVIGKGDFYYYDEVTSTNDEAYRLAEDGAPEGTLVVSDTQTAGKGRLGRKWSSPKGEGVYFSLVLRPDVNISIIPTITLISALAIVDTVERVCGVKAEIKWPNDVLVSGRKLCGILTEMKAQPDMVEFIVLGIGINVNTSLSKLPEGSTSLKHETGGVVLKKDILKGILEEFETDYNIFKREGFLSLREECKVHSAVIGEQVSVSEHGRILEGTVLDIDESGALMVEDSRGELRRIFSGDVTLCRTK